MPVDRGWGARFASLLPATLRNEWAQERLPKWACDDLRLSGELRMAMLGADVWDTGIEEVSDRVRNLLLNFVSARRAEIRDLPLHPGGWPPSLSLMELPLSNRARNCLEGPGKGLATPGQFAKATFGTLLDVRSLGVVSMLEIACAAEAAITRTSAVPLSDWPLDELLEAGLEAWASQVGPSDPRFEGLIPGNSYSSLFDAVDTLTSSPDQDVRALRELRAALPRIRERAQEVTAAPLDRQLSDFMTALSRYKGERLDALLNRFGWAGSPPITLEEAGRRLEYHAGARSAASIEVVRSIRAAPRVRRDLHAGAGRRFGRSSKPVPVERIRCGAAPRHRRDRK